MRSTARIVAFLIVIFCYSDAAAQRYERYCNARFGYCLEYPSALIPQPEAHNGDGRVFQDKAGNDRLRVYGTGNWNFNDEGNVISLAQLYRMELKGGRFPSKPARIVTYSALKNGWFVLSGTVGNDVFYLKVVAREDAFCYALLKYPKADSAIYNPVAARLAGSFR